MYLGGLILSGAILWAMNASRVGPLESCLNSCSDPDPEVHNHLRLLSFNMLHGFPRFEYLRNRMNLIAEEIKSLAPDIACLQEVPWTLYTGSVSGMISKRVKMNYAYLPANGNRWAILFSEGEAIFSKFPLENVLYRELEPTPGFFEHRVVLHATVRHPKTDIHVFCTHLTGGDPAINQAQTATLYEFVMEYGGEFNLIAGDFNAAESSPQIGLLTTDWIDAYRHVHPDDDGKTCCIDQTKFFGRDEYEERIDYIFVAGRTADCIQIIDSRRIFNQPYFSPTGTFWLSDHAGLLVDIELR